jgi:hypothetical protein
MTDSSDAPNGGFERWWLNVSFDTMEAKEICRRAWDAALSETAATAQPCVVDAPRWIPVRDVLERQVAWIEVDARHVAVVRKGQEYILHLPELPPSER